MKNCLVLKLKGASDNSELPVYVNEVTKQLFKATTQKQYVDISSYIGDVAFNNIEVEVNFCIPSDSTYLEDGDIRLFDVRSSQLWIAINSNHIIVRGSNAESAFLDQEVSVNIIHSLKWNTSSKKITLDGVEHSYSFTHAGSAIQTASVFSTLSNFAYAQRPGSVFIGELKFKKVSTNTVLLDAVPVIKDGISYVKNVLEENDYLSADSGSLEAFNLS